MAVHVNRSRTCHLDLVSNFDGAREVSWEVPAAGKSVLEKQHYPKPAALRAVPDSKNILIPPYHWHWYQEEQFTITSGRFIITLEGTETIVSATDPQPVSIPPQARHTFKVDPTCEGPCKIEFSTATSPVGRGGPHEEDFGINEAFFRNLYSYLDDCHDQGIAPSLPQLLLFLHQAEVSLAFPGPRWLANPVSYYFGLVGGVWIGEYLLGYKRTYPEYCDSTRLASKKAR